MNIHYTEHARKQMAKRQLESEWVERIVRSPARTEVDGIDDSLEHRLGIVPELANRVLRVVISRDEPRRVITAYLDRTMKGKL